MSISQRRRREGCSIPQKVCMVLTALLRENIFSHKEGKRFEATDAHFLWQADFQHTLYLPDPAAPKKRRKAILFVILNDYSRLIVHGEFYWDERLPRIEAT